MRSWGRKLDLPVTYCKPLTPFRAPALKDETSILGAHTDPKPVRSFAMPPVWLKRAFTFHCISPGGPDRSRPVLKGTVNVSERVWRVSMRTGLC